MSAWGAVAGGFVGTVLLTTGLRAASELRLTRMDIPFLLGTAFTTDRVRAKAIGYVLHLFFGQVFAFIYYAIFLILDESGFALGALFGLVHGFFVVTTLVNVLLPVVHPRMGDLYSAADASPLLERPGFLMLNYGRTTPAVTLAVHVIYGAIVGGFVSLS